MGLPLPDEVYGYENRAADSMVSSFADGSVRVAFLAAGVFFYVDLSEDQRSLVEVKDAIRSQRSDQNWLAIPNSENRTIELTIRIAG